MKRLSMHLLGGFRVMVDDRPVTEFEADTARALLMYLALNTAYPHRREYIAQLLWADQPRESALVNLRTALSRLRHALADKDADLPIVLAGRQDLQLNPQVEVWVDTREIGRLLGQVKNHSHRHPLGCPWCLRRLTQIDELYRGEFASGLFVDSLPFEEWQAARREEVHHLVVQVFATLAAYHYSSGAYDQAERYSRRELALEPWNEEAHQQLMRALFASGRRSAALAQYAACRARLRDELGVEPSEETTALYHEIAATRRQPGSPRASFAQAEAVLAATKGASLNNLPLPATALLGREAELDLLLERVVSPSIRLTTVVGDPGVGKSRLALAAAQALLGSFAHGVCWVTLTAPASAPGARHAQNRVASQIAQALGLAPAHDTDAVGLLASFMRDKELLLVLDNLEPLVGAAGLLQDLLAAAPKLALLITSEQALKVRDEAVLALHRLPAPEAGAGPHDYKGGAVQLAADWAASNSADGDEARQHNLPEPLTSFVGRSHELATLARLLDTTRLLTLSGPGGAGKTRLSLAFAGAVRERFPAGVWLVELGPLADATLVLPTLAIALGVREEPDGLSLKRLASFLGEKQLLLVLDNCEHLVDTCAHLAEQLLAGCPHLKIVASSREPLRIAGEALFQVPALSIPSPRRLASADELSRYEAVQLFVERARMVNPSFELTEANAEGVAQICTQLDGIPLAIELAAARLRMLTVAQIAARLGERFRLLTNGTRTVLPRHQTLQALIDWSYNLLGEQERALLHHLAVFAGGWTLEAVEAVCASEAVENVLTALAYLVDKSMVQVEPGNEGMRYRMLETIRQYALEKLEASGQADAARRRHAGYYLTLAEMAGEHILWRTTRQTEWLVRLEVEHDNLRAALSYCIQPFEVQQGAAGETIYGQDSSAAVALAELGVRLAAALGTFWDTRGHLSEGRAWLARALAQSHPIAPAVRAKALNQGGRLAWSHEDTGTARELFEESLGLLRKLERQDETANVLHNLGEMALAQGDLERAARLFDEGLTMRRLLGDRRGIAWTLKALGDIARFRGEYARASALVHEALALFESFGELGSIAHCKWTLGHIARSEGDDVGAAAHYGQALLLAQQVGDGLLIASIRHNQAFLALHRHDDALAEALLSDSLAISREIEAKGQIAWNLAAFGGVAAVRGQSERAARLLGAVEAWFESTGNYIGPTERAEHERYLAAARVQASGDMFAQAFATGRAMSLEQALACAVGESA